ncbi:MAG: DNA polymerase/3'-5' exonuclease PolX [Chthoniobacteraceae bacterium]
MPEVSKDQIADTLEDIAMMLELKGENPFKIRAYRNATRAIETFTGNLRATADAGTFSEVEGIGDAIAEKITTLVTTGALEYHTNLKAEFPPGLFDMFDISGMGPKKIQAVWKELSITSVEELEKGCKDGRVAGLKGFGEKTAANILKGIEDRKKHAGRFRLGEIAANAERMLDDLRSHPEVIRVAACGSFRRRRETCGDLDFLVSTREPKIVSEDFVAHEFVESIIAHGETKSSVRWLSGIQADLRVVKDAEFPFAMNYFTGSKEHNIVMRQRALARGWTLNEYRLGPVDSAKTKPDPVPDIREEADLYRALGLDFIEPELRENMGEFKAAEEHTLPKLVELENLRGTFHNHTTESDGRSTLREMAEAAMELGLQYLGIADHSKASVQAHGLDEERLLAQLAEIRKLNDEFAPDFRIFAGSEVDIHKDGSLDFDDEILAQLDYTVASVHNAFAMSEADMTARIIRAMDNKHVTMLGHLTGRLLLMRDGYPVDHTAVIEAAAATGTIIELNANPRRLDMDWRWWPLAKAKGVKCAINPDAHHTSQLQFLKFGVGTARKGWLTRYDVVNTLPLGKIEAVLAKKRQMVC